VAAAGMIAKHGRVAVIEAEADIRRSPRDVFDYASEPANEPAWNPRMTRIEQLTGAAVGVGARYRMQFTSGPPASSEVVRFERPRLWEMAGGSSLLRSRWTGRVLPNGDGAHLELRLELRLRGPLRLALPLVRRRMHADLARDIATIKAVLESVDGVQQSAADHR
jgi:uncharacterized protein YndB with AHSA1/START domain